VPAVNQHGNLDSSWAAIINQCVKSSSDGAPGEKDIIHKDHLPVVNSTWQISGLDHGLVMQSCPIVSVKGDIEGADEDR